MAELLNIDISKTQLPDGKWLLYYNGDDIDLDCGNYYLKIIVDGEPWFSELFRVKEVKAATNPTLIKDIFHTPLRFYDNKLKQDYYRNKNFCDVGLINPIDRIMPYIIDLTGFGYVGTLETKIICHDGTYEYDLSNELQYTVDTENYVLYQKGLPLSGQLYCGIYYLQVKVNDQYFYSEHFKVENITNVPITELYLFTESNSGFQQVITEDSNPIILDI